VVTLIFELFNKISLNILVLVVLLLTEKREEKMKRKRDLINSDLTCARILYHMQKYILSCCYQLSQLSNEELEDEEKTVEFEKRIQYLKLFPLEIVRFYSILHTQYIKARKIDSVSLSYQIKIKMDDCSSSSLLLSIATLLQKLGDRFLECDYPIPCLQCSNELKGIIYFHPKCQRSDLRKCEKKRYAIRSIWNHEDDSFISWLPEEVISVILDEIFDVNFSNHECTFATYFALDDDEE